MRVLAVLSAACALYALWSVERVDLDCDLQLAAPPEVRPGEPFALRALVFCDLDALEGPRLVTPEVTVRSVDAQGRELVADGASAPLRPTAISTLDGVHRAVGDRDQFLVATAVHDGVPLTVKRALRVRRDAAPERMLPREAGPLQQYALGRVRALGGQPAPDRLLPRVVGGACVPEVPCTILLWVGAPAAEVALRTRAEVLQAPRGESEGVLRFVVKVHGPEAELTFEARRGGSPVAERALRLPVALGEVAITGGAALDLGGDDYEVWFPPGRTELTVDAFVEGRWNHSMVTSRARFALGGLLAGPVAGLVRIQARSDRFTSEGAGARLVQPERPERSLPKRVAELARALESEPWRGWLAPLDEPGLPRASELWANELPAFASEDPQAAAAFLLAPAESVRAQVPLPVSGRPAQLARLERTRVRMRYGVAGAVALSAWLIALSVTRRGLLAVDQAQAILDEARAEGADEPGRVAPRERINARAKVLLMGLAVAAAFLAGALLIASKSLWF
jgi:hypothetical protein